jgi:hypothetical protein
LQKAQELLSGRGKALSHLKKKKKSSPIGNKKEIFFKCKAKRVQNYRKKSYD